MYRKKGVCTWRCKIGIWWILKIFENAQLVCLGVLLVAGTDFFLVGFCGSWSLFIFLPRLMLLQEHVVKMRKHESFSGERRRKSETTKTKDWDNYCSHGMCVLSVITVNCNVEVPSSLTVPLFQFWTEITKEFKWNGMKFRISFVDYERVCTDTKSANVSQCKMKLAVSLFDIYVCVLFSWLEYLWLCFWHVLWS